MIDNTKEYILCAAYLLKEEYWRTEHVTNYKDTNAQEKYGTYDDVYKCALGRRHNDILQRYGKDKVANVTGGFYTSWGRYVDREEGARIALACGQCTEDSIQFIDRLFSEDLY